MMNRIAIAIFSISLIAGLPGCRNEMKEARTLLPRAVKVTQVTRRPIKKILNASGTLKALHSIQIFLRPVALFRQFISKQG